MRLLPMKCQFITGVGMRISVVDIWIQDHHLSLKLFEVHLKWQVIDKEDLSEVRTYIKVTGCYARLWDEAV